MCPACTISCRRERALLKSSCAERIATAQQSPPENTLNLTPVWIFGVYLDCRFDVGDRDLSTSVSYAKTEVYLTWASYQAFTVLALQALFAYALLPSFLGPMCALAVAVK